ncbi:hypothetical protein XNOV1_A016970 [Xyrichtys novacula]|uniref:S5 DRBM domain-containing protein n=1 Tax=Xyrichtys novacula TaxID=13765 RepID=A0AAV1GY74_XYRNO|nr:hypothetical protein XNOV1_A016970 [Xyrichtys novacula]
MIIKTPEEVYLYSLPIMESKILLEVLKIMPVQEQTRAGQHPRFEAFVAIGDGNLEAFVAIGNDNLHVG